MIGKLSPTSAQDLHFREFAPSMYILKELTFSYSDVSKNTKTEQRNTRSKQIHFIRYLLMYLSCNVLTDFQLPNAKYGATFSQICEKRISSFGGS